MGKKRDRDPGTPREPGQWPAARLLIVLRGRTVILLPKPKSAAKALGGAAKRKYPNGYLGAERESWQ